MIILDTNVISEMQNPTPDPRVMAWLDSLDRTTAYITAITAAELHFGVNRLPAGKRRTALSQAIDEVINTDFYGRILPFDAAAASHFGMIAAAAEKKGLPVSFTDGAVGAIARANNLCPVATRDVAPFAAMDIETINPWTETDLEL